MRFPSGSHIHRHFLVGILGLVAFSPVQAQQEGQIQRAETLQDTPGLRGSGLLNFNETQEDDLYTPATPGDDDIGLQLLLKEEDEAKYFTFYASAAGYYTTNIALTNSPEVDGAFFSEQAGLTYSRPFLGSFVGFLAVRQQSIRYDRLSGFDFDSLIGDVGLTYVAREFYDLNIYFRYRYNRLMEPFFGEGFFDNNTLTFGLQKYWNYSRGIWFYAGAEGIFGYSEPSVNQRDSGVLYFGGNVDLTRRLSVQLFYSMAYHAYNNIERDDFNQNLSLLFIFQLTDWASINFQGSWANNISSRSVFDYDAFNLGGGLQVQLEF